jgi:hypothetical protein
MDELKKFRVMWRHGPAPGLTYYDGEKHVLAYDAESAAHTIKQILKREACFEPSCITVTTIEEVP